MLRAPVLDLMKAQEATLTAIACAARDLHDSVNQKYNATLPYGYHLDMVARYAADYGHEVLADAADLLPLLFGAYFHDSIEDARLSYNDVTRRAAAFMNDAQAYMAAEIVYALTNDKGRTRSERAGERYYAGIRATPYAPFVKLCDRAANTAFSARAADGGNSRMCRVYASEWPHFLAAIRVDRPADVRFTLPTALIAHVEGLMRP
ncbi:MAG: hypothetical protein SPE72_07535 [Alloprevotella sp.]|nr:hypothetical protein [Alloprevotella sp.]